MSTSREIGPSDISSLNDAQLQGLLQSLPEFTGNPVHGAKLLRRLIEGKEWVRKKYRHLFSGVKSPDIALSVIEHAEPDEFLPLLGYLDGENVILLYVNDFAKDILEDPDALLEPMGPADDVPDHHGTMSDFYFLGGVEETDHRRYEIVHGITPHLRLDQDISGAEYDAQPHELEALRLKLQAAEELGMPAVTRQVLAQRIKLAELFT